MTMSAPVTIAVPSSRSSALTRLTLGLMLLFAAAFAWFQLAPGQWDLIFLKTLRSYDEATNATVAANLTRDLFPPAVRLNPLIERYTTWFEGPLWQHIPPLFLYFPLPFFWLDGGPSPEVYRLTYAGVELATGLVLIAATAFFTRSRLAAVCAAIAALCWARTPFTAALVNGERFGVSDTVLAFATTCAFAGVLYYLARRERLTTGQYALLGLAMAFPMLVKHALGAIPAATLAGLFLWDRKRLGTGPWAAAGVFVAVLAAYYGGLYGSSPETFLGTFGVAFQHVGADYEGWARPWHEFLTYYLPGGYLQGPTWPLFLVALVVGGGVLARKGLSSREREVAYLALGWFLWNLLAVSVITSKAPNFIFQTYLLGLFAAIYIPAAALAPRLRNRADAWLAPARVTLLLALSTVLAVGTLAFGVVKFRERRAAPYVYQLPLERIYHMAETGRDAGWGLRDLVLIKLSDPEETPPPAAPGWLIGHRSEEATFDFWGRNAFMFLTGSEAWVYDDFRRLPLEREDLQAALRRKYDRMHVAIAKEKPWPPFAPGSVKQARLVEGVWLVTLASVDPRWIPRLPPHPHPLGPRWP